MKIMNIKGVTFHLSDETAMQVERDLRAYEAEMADFEALKRAEANARETGDWSFYSDLYKDIYGVRPRWMWAS